MAARAVRSRPIFDAWWLQLLARTFLAILALVLLVSGTAGYDEFFNDIAEGRFDDAHALWFAWLPRMIGAGLLFGLAAWLPLRRVRYRWSRLLLAALALAPLAQYWWLFLFQLQRNNAVDGWLYRVDWFMRADQKSLAVLAGVAIASGFTAARERTPEDATAGESVAGPRLAI